ncbi:hypothetical protein [Vibrio antiquarius]|uniref:hypothetical protein n=1 Tax=Vibrio antiquarius (strain Ex25) TaxID=150340 RepID=UPI002657AE05|nr:hypothetical protein [Vibrio antiquarius]MCR9581209.1 hypothetical protein [Vibrio antiquarius]MCR9616341.1 hypothetical protein [Vibrio antiquarius]
MNFVRIGLKKYLPDTLVKKIGEYKREFKRKKVNLYNDSDFISEVYKKKAGFENHKNTIETLVLRGSHADYGFYVRGTHNIYNLGLTSSDLYTNYKLFEKVKEQAPKLKNIVIFFSVFTPGLSLIKTREKYRCVAYKYFFDVEYQENGLIETKNEKKIIAAIKKTNKPDVDLDYNGYDEKSVFGSIDDAQSRVRTHIRENKREPDQMIWLDRLIAGCEQAGYNLLIVIPPVRSNYRSILPNESELFEKLYSINNGRANIESFYDSEIFSDDDLGDTDHLNESGAKKLKNQVIKLLK